MNIYKIPETLAPKYHGAGHALAAICGAALVDIVYLADVLPDFDPECPGAVAGTINDPRLAPTVRRLQALGEVSFGMLSCWEFVEL